MKHVQNLEKLLSVANLIMNSQVDLLEGAISIRRLLFGYIDDLSDADYSDITIFILVQSEVDDIARKIIPYNPLWDLKDLQSKGKELQEVVQLYRDDIMQGCKNLIRLINEGAFDLE